MPIEVFQNLLDLGRSHFWDVARNRIYRHFKTAPSNRQRIAYINKQHTDIHLPHWKHESFIASMHRLAAEYDDVEFDDLILSELTPEEQFRRISLATIIVGIHGDGLTHLVWMPPRSAVIELFLPLTFSRDYQVAAEVLGHDYTVIVGGWWCADASGGVSCIRSESGSPWRAGITRACWSVARRWT